MKEEFIKYLDLGLSVIPLGKITKGADGKKDIQYPIKWKEYQLRRATKEEASKWNSKNVGIVTGNISGIMVLDIDTYKKDFDKDLLKSFNIPPTPVQKTASGGTQYFFKHPKGISIQNDVCIGKKGSGIDIRGDGGMVIAPPSTTSYGEYSWIVSPFDIEFAEVPPKLLALLTPHSSPTTPRKKLTDLVGLKEGEGRNNAIASLVGKLINTAHVSKWESEIYPVVVNINNTYSPPLSQVELRTIFDSITKKHLNKKEGIDLLFTLTSSGAKRFIQNTENICRVLRHHFELRYDAFKNSFEIKAKDNWRPFEDNDAVELQTKISMIYPAFSKVGKEMVYDAVIKVCKEHEYDSASDFIKGIKWDGIKRLDDWLNHAYGTPKDAYHKAVASNWMKGLVKRIIEPGCKFDYVLVLEGEQGVKKSTSLGILGGDWHVETTMSTDNKDFFMQFHGKAIIEFSEGETLSRTEVKRMKAIITMQKDTYRPPYERASKDFPRRCVFAMTTNQTEYLKDETGNRRWLPVTVRFKEADIKWLEDNRNQLFAEAYHRVFVSKETIYEFPKEATQKEQEARRIKDPNADVVFEWYAGLDKKTRDLGVSVHQAYKAINGVVSGKSLSQYDAMVMANTLKEVIGLTKKQTMINGARTVRWFDTEGVIKENTLNLTDELDRVFPKEW